MSKSSHFDIDAIPLDPDTKIRSTKPIELAGLFGAHQVWSFDGVVAESLIFHTEDLRQMTDSELKSLAIESGLCEPTSQFSLGKNASGYTFINFNFIY